MPSKEEVLDRLKESPQVVYGELTKQKEQASGWVSACCPFHDDKSPSFAWNAEHLGWKCQGCGGKGSVFDFYMKQHNCGFKDCLSRLAQQLNIKPGSTPPPQPKPEQKPKSKQKTKKLPLPPIPETLVGYFMQELNKRPEFLAKLQEKRGVTPESVEQNEIGYDPQRKRITLPVRDETGTLVNFRTYNAHKPGKMRHYWIRKDGGGSIGYGSPPRLYNLHRAHRAESLSSTQSPLAFQWCLFTETWQWKRVEVCEGNVVADGDWRRLNEEAIAQLEDIARVVPVDDPEGRLIHAALDRGRVLQREKRASRGDQA